MWHSSVLCLADGQCYFELTTTKQLRETQPIHLFHCFQSMLQIKIDFLGPADVFTMAWCSQTHMYKCPAQVCDDPFILRSLRPSYTQRTFHLIWILRHSLRNACFSVSSKVKISERFHIAKNLPLTWHCMVYNQAVRPTQTWYPEHELLEHVVKLSNII